MRLEKIIGWLVISLAIVGACILLAVLCYEFIDYDEGVIDLRILIVPFAAAILLLFGSVAVIGLELSYPGRYLKNSYRFGLVLVILGCLFFVPVFQCMQDSDRIKEALLMLIPSGIFIPSGYWLMSKRRAALYVALFCIGFTTTFVGSGVSTELSRTWAASSILVSVLGGLIVVTTLALLLRERRWQ